MIFITENDVIGKEKQLYRIERKIEELYEPFNDGEHIIYVNGVDNDATTSLGKLMHDFFCTDPDEMLYKELANKVRYFKEDEKGVASMCKVLEEMRNEAAKDADKKAVERTTVSHIKEIMDKLKYTVDQAMDLLSIPQSQRSTYAGLVGKRMQ